MAKIPTAAEAFQAWRGSASKNAVAVIDKLVADNKIGLAPTDEKPAMILGGPWPTQIQCSIHGPPEIRLAIKAFFGEIK